MLVQSDNDRLIVYQLGNVYLLMALIGLAVFYTPFFSASSSSSSPFPHCFTTAAGAGAGATTTITKKEDNREVKRIIKAYLVALACGDIGHLWVTYRVMGPLAFLDVGNWNAMAWGNVGATVSLIFGSLSKAC